VASWNVSGLRRFGVIDDRFCFEAGESNGLLSVALAKPVSQSINKICMNTPYRICSAMLNSVKIYNRKTIKADNSERES